MLLEYCDRGALSRAVEQGKLKKRGGDGSPELVSQRGSLKSCWLLPNHCSIKIAPSACVVVTAMYFKDLSQQGFKQLILLIEQLSESACAQ